MILTYWKDFYHYRALLFSWVERDLRLRYKQTLLGGIWAILQPLVLMLLFVLIFSVFVTLPSDGIPYPVFSYTALLPWTFFSTSVTFGVNSLVNNITLVTKIYFPREILPIASIGAALVDFGIASGILVLMMLVYHIPFYLTLLWVPLLLLIQIIFTAGIILIASMMNAFYRDVRFIIPLFLQALMYASPIIYPLSSVPEKYRTVYLLNPMAGLIDSYRRVILKGVYPDLTILGIAALISVLILTAGYLYFKQAEKVLPDVI